MYTCRDTCRLNFPFFLIFFLNFLLTLTKLTCAISSKQNILYLSTFASMDYKKNRPVARGVAGGATYHPKSAKRSCFPQKLPKWPQNGGFVQGLRGQVQKVHFWGPKGLLGSRTSPKFILATGLEKNKSFIPDTKIFLLFFLPLPPPPPSFFLIYFFFFKFLKVS